MICNGKLVSPEDSSLLFGRYRPKFICRISLLLFPVLLVLSCTPKPPDTALRATHGVTSWYGKDFHGRPTSSGEIFDMHARTCAHREYPFGTRLKVTSLDSGKTVLCTVNDRGPFVSGRDLDLSYAAAREIDLIGPGTGRVRIEPMGRDEKYLRDVRFDSSKGPYTIQIGSFRDHDNALRLKAGLDLKYGSVYIMNAVIKDDVFYRVRIGNFSERNKAASLAKKLAFEGYDAVVTRYEAVK